MSDSLNRVVTVSILFFSHPERIGSKNLGWVAVFLMITAFLVHDLLHKVVFQRAQQIWLNVAGTKYLVVMSRAKTRNLEQNSATGDGEKRRT